MEQQETTGFSREIDPRKIRLNLIVMMVFDTLLASIILLTFLYSVVGLTYEQIRFAFWGFLWIAPLTMATYSLVVYLYFRPVMDFVRRYRLHEATDRLTIINAQSRVLRGPLAVSIMGVLFWCAGAALMAVWMVNSGGISHLKGILLVLGGAVAAFGTNSHSLYRIRKLVRPFTRILSLQSQASKSIFKEATTSIKTRFQVNLLSLIVFALFFAYLTLVSETLNLMKSQTRIQLENRVSELITIVRQYNEAGMQHRVIPFIDEIRIGSSGYAFLVDTSMGQISISHIDPELYQDVKERILASSTIDFVEYDPKNLALAFGSVPGSNQILGVVMSMDDFRPDMRKFALTSFLVIIICIVLSMAMANASGEDIADPINELINEASLITEGELDHQIYSEGSDEIAVLATTFEKMRLSLKRQMEERSKKVKELTTLYEIGQQLEKIATNEMKLNALLTSIVYKLNFDRAVLFVIDAEKRQLLGDELRGNNPNNLNPPGIVIDIANDAEIVVRTFKSTAPILVEDALNDSRVTDSMHSLFQSSSFITVPLRTIAGPIGVIVVDNITSERVFNQEDLRILSIITNQVMASIQSGRSV